MAKKETKIQRTYNGIPIDSDEEEMVLMYLEELMEHGYIKKIERAESYLLSEKLVHSYTLEEVLKTKTKTVTKNQVLLNEHIYTPEFKVLWSIQGLLLFTDCITDTENQKFVKPFIGKTGISILEIKPGFDRNNMERLFIINRKWMWEKHKIFINLIHPHKLFENTFTPKKYLFTKTGKKRIIHWEIKTLEEYLKTIQNGKF